MFRRWLIRGLALTLLALCLAAWAASHWRMVGVEITELDRSQRLIIESGLLIIADGEQLMWVPGKIIWLHRPADNVQKGYARTKYHFAGFVYDPPTTRNLRTRVAAVPLWFPTLILGGLVGFVWRKTKPKPKSFGFPIEPTPSEKPPAKSLS